MTEQHLAQVLSTTGKYDPIIIIGAGPIGMTAALGLSYYGLPCIVLDNDVGTAIEGSRAIFIERTTLEILGAWSTVGQQMLEQGTSLVGGRTFFRNTELYKTFTAPPDPLIRYPRFINFPQNHMEALLYQTLQTQPRCQVLWQHKVIDITQHDQAVELVAETPEGKKTFQAPYVLAADGGRSTTRHLLHLDFPGESRNYHFLILDVKMHLETPRERWFWFDPPFNPGYTALLHPQPDNIYRLDYQLPPDADLDAIQQPEALHKLITTTVGERPYEIVWKSIYTYHQRALTHFKHGRIFFLGDAAHLMSPFGGRGLNSGVQDVANLVWKLVLVLGGRAPETLLDTYDDERHAAAVENLRLTGKTMEFLVPPPGPQRWKRDMILRLSVYFPFMRRYVNAGSLSNPFTYLPSSVISKETRLPMYAHNGTDYARQEQTALKRFRAGPVTGAYAPEAALKNAVTGTTVSTLDLFWKSFIIFYFSDDPEKGMHLLQQIPFHQLELPITCYIISPRAPTGSPPEGIMVLLDEEKRAANAFNAITGTCYLVRPDRHIAARRFQADVSELPVLLRRAVGQDIAHAGTAYQPADSMPTR